MDHCQHTVVGQQTEVDQKQLTIPPEEDNVS